MRKRRVSKDYSIYSAAAGETEVITGLADRRCMFGLAKTSLNRQGTLHLKNCNAARRQ